MTVISKEEILSSSLAKKIQTSGYTTGKRSEQAVFKMPYEKVQYYQAIQKHNKKSQCDNSVRQRGSYQRECVQITNIEKDIAEVECLYFEGRTENNTANIKNYLETA